MGQTLYGKDGHTTMGVTSMNIALMGAFFFFFFFAWLQMQVLKSWGTVVHVRRYQELVHYLIKCRLGSTIC